MIMSIILSAWNLSVEMAPYLILGFVVAGVIHVVIPVGMIGRHLGKDSNSSVLKAAIFGIPIPLCSCGVLPVATGLRESGASRSATLSFLITTPATGADSILATGALMGWFFTLIRTLSSLLIGLGAGLLSKTIYKNNLIRDKKNERFPGKQNIITRENPVEKTEKRRSPVKKIFETIHYAFIDLPSSFSGSLLLGLILGGLITVLVPAQTVNQYLGSGILSIMVATLIAIPMYVCATGSIPIAVAMIVAGFSPGAALAFLSAGPATNTVSVVTVKNLLGKKHMYVYLAVIFVGAISSGLLLDIFNLEFQLVKISHAHTGGASLFQQLCAVFLLLNVVILFTRNLYKKFQKK